MRKRSIQTLLITVGLTVGAVICTFGQTATATLKGIVVDGSGNVLPNVTVTLISNANGLKKTFSTDGNGHYQFVYLEPGSYTLEARSSNFKSYRQPLLKLEVGQTVEQTITLATGDLTETVNIVATEPTGLDTRT